ncbi:MAG: MOSC domain-containing protein [Clostridiales bacterium]|nr:MOSC domain-containing protein [Clostridiales bacterium]
MGKVIAVCISERKGTVKTPVKSAEIIKDFGLKGDAHAGLGRQVSLLSYEKFTEFRESAGGKVPIVPGVFGENLLVSGFDFKNIPLGTRLKCGDCVLELMQIGKTCHSGCEISKITGKCIMPAEGVFARVIEGGVISEGDELEIVNKAFRAGVLTSSDRAYNGEREDLSGPAIIDYLKSHGYDVATSSLMPDDGELLSDALVKMCDLIKVDVIFTTGGTGFSPRDVMPEATLRVADRNAPGIAESIRMNSLKYTPHAMLSRGVSVIRGNTLIINLPGSPKAVIECLDYILPVLSHGLGLLRGEKMDK